MYLYIYFFFFAVVDPTEQQRAKCAESFHDISSVPQAFVVSEGCKINDKQLVLSCEWTSLCLLFLFSPHPCVENASNLRLLLFFFFSCPTTPLPQKKAEKKRKPPPFPFPSFLSCSDCHGMTHVVPLHPAILMRVLFMGACWPAGERGTPTMG